MVAVFDASRTGLFVYDGGDMNTNYPVILSHSQNVTRLLLPQFIQVFLSTSSEENIDVYRLKIGVRTLHWNAREFLINGRPIYLRGFGRHEDSDVSG